MSELFAKTVRPAILAASRSDRLRRTAEQLPVTRKMVGRFVPGETLDRVLDSVAA
ncbi:MAG: proline dehydrogenase, partial [Mycobacterium sp.]